MTTGSERRFQAVVFASGIVATAAGLHTVLTGARSVPGQGAANSALESEMRYYAGFYAAFGLAALHAAPQAGSDAKTIRALSGCVFASGLGRLAAWRQVGPPHPLQRALLGIELAGPAAIVGWQARLQSRAA